jgi:lysozyme
MANIPASWCDVDERGNPDPTRCNPIKRYRSTSYHHVIIASNTTDIYTDLVKNTGTTLYDHPDIKGTGARFTPQRTTSNIPYIVLLNSLTDTQYSLKTFTINNVLMSDAGSNNPQNISPTAEHTTGSMVIDEPYSANFLETLSSAAQQLNVQPINMCFYVKIFFIGYLADGTTEQFGYIAPIGITLLTIDATFNFAGASYAIDFVYMVSGTANSPSLSTVGGISVSSFPTIGAVTKEFENKINTSVAATAQAAKPPLKPDTYHIIVDDFYRNMPIDNIKTSNVDHDGNIILATGQESSITSMLDGIVQLSSHTITSMKPDNQGRITIPIITSQYEVRDSARIITYKVSPKIMYTVPPLVKKNCPSAEDTELQRTGAIKTLTDTLIKNNLLMQYDYIFSGKNTDIISFDMRLSSAFNKFLMGFEEVSPTSQVNQTTKVAPDTNTSIVLQANNGSCNENSGTLPTNTQGISKYPDQHIAYRHTLNRFATTTTTAAVLEILGNPIYLGGVSLPGSNEEIPPTPTIKINVFMPFVDPLTGQPDPTTLNTADATFRSPFWADGLFQINQIVHKFDHGSFTQELSLIALVTQDALPDTTTEVAPNQPSSVTSKDKVKAKDAATSNIVRPANPGSGNCRTVKGILVSTGTDGGTGNTNIAAFLKMIRVAEGTGGPNGYRTFFGNGLFDSYAAHPRIVHTGGSLRSTAAGAYQFKSDTWSDLQKAHKDLTDFTPESQDRAAVYLIKRRNAYNDVINGNLDSAIDKCSFEWASFPPGRYGQGYVCLPNMHEIYEANGGKYTHV